MAILSILKLINFGKKTSLEEIENYGKKLKNKCF